MIGIVAAEPVDAASPCTGVCVIDRDTRWCRGCGRTLDEIAGWATADVATRRAMRERLPARMALLAEHAPIDRSRQVDAAAAIAASSSAVARA